MDNTQKHHNLGSSHSRQQRGGMGMMRRGEKAKDFKGTIKKLIKYLSPYIKAFVAVFILAIASTTFSIIGPKILGNITNQIVDDYIHITVYDEIMKNLPQGYVLPQGTKGTDVLKQLPQDKLNKIPKDVLSRVEGMDLSVKPSMDFDYIGSKIVLLVGIYFASAVFSYIVEWIMSGITQKVTYKLRKEIFVKISKLPLKYFDTNSYGDVLSRMTNDVDTISQTLSRGIVQVITSVTMIIGILIMMFSINSILTVIALVILP